MSVWTSQEIGDNDGTMYPCWTLGNRTYRFMYTIRCGLSWPCYWNGSALSYAISLRSECGASYNEIPISRDNSNVDEVPLLRKSAKWKRPPLACGWWDQWGSNPTRILAKGGWCVSVQEITFWVDRSSPVTGIALEVKSLVHVIPLWMTGGASSDYQ